MNCGERTSAPCGGRIGPDEGRGQNVAAKSPTAAGGHEADGVGRLRRNLMVWGAVAVAGVLLTLCEGLVGYFQEEPIRTSRVVFRLLGMAGWLLVLYGFVKVIWNDRKRK